MRMYFFRPKNETPKNKKMRFLAPKNNEKTKFGRPVIGVWAQAPGALAGVRGITPGMQNPAI